MSNYIKWLMKHRAPLIMLMLLIQGLEQYAGMSWLMTSHWIYYRCTSGHPVQLFLLVRRDFSRCPASQYAPRTTTIFPRPTPVYHGYIYRCIHPRWCYAVKSSWPLKQRHLDLCSFGVSDSHFISLSVWHMHTFVRIGQLLRFTQHWRKA